MALRLVFSSLSICLYWSAGISLLAALSNLTRKLAVGADVNMLALSCKSSWDTSVSDSLPSARDCDLLSSVEGAIWLHKCSGGPASSISTSSTSY